jgi:hypothetical protein
MNIMQTIQLFTARYHANFQKKNNVELLFKRKDILDIFNLPHSIRSFLMYENFRHIKIFELIFASDSWS